MKQETYKINFNIYLQAKRIKLQSSELKPLFWPLKLNWRYFSVTNNSTKSRVDCNLLILVAKEKGWKNLGKTGIFWALSSCRTWVLKWRPNKKFAFEKVKALSGLSPWAKFTNGNRSSEQGESRALKANITTCWEKAKSTFATCERSELRFQYFLMFMTKSALGSCWILARKLRKFKYEGNSNQTNLAFSSPVFEFSR